MSIKVIGLVVLAGGMALLTPSPNAKQSKVEVTVVDETGRPVQGATASIRRSAWIHTRPFISLITYKLGFFLNEPSEVRVLRLTDKNGFAKFTYRNFDSWRGVSAVKDGYYMSGIQLPTGGDFRSKKWLPYPTKATLVLREIHNPIPLIVINAAHELKWPRVLDEPVGFDMERRDWMPPYGGGEREDLRFLGKVNQNIELSRNFSHLTLTFAGEHDGFISIEDVQIISESMFKYPYNAPLEGYMNNQIVFDKQKLIDERTQNHFFRIRTELDEQGNVASALYGRMEYLEYSLVGRFQYIRFYYWFNPTPNDRNLEWDGKTNLFSNPNDRQQ